MRVIPVLSSRNSFPLMSETQALAESEEIKLVFLSARGLEAEDLQRFNDAQLAILVNDYKRSLN